MTNLTRVTGKTFGETATATGDDPEIGQFGSAKAGTYVGTTDIATIQSLPAWSNGFIDSVTPSTQFPPLPEVTGAMKVLSYQENYLLQKGIADWDSGTTYYTNDYCKLGNKIYYSLVDSNINHTPESNPNYWTEFSPSSRNIGEIITSLIPLTDAGLHLLDGALISGSGSYSAFVDYIANLYGDSTNIPAYFTDETTWQQTVSDYGVCGKFVYDSVNNTVRLPKVTGIIEGTIDANVLGDLVEAGLPNITGYVGHFYTSESSTNGALSLTGNGSTGANSGTTTNKWRSLSIDASNSSSIYGNSSTVQPQTIKGYYYIVIANSTKTNIQVDIDEIATDLNGKADVDLTNCTNVANIKMAHNAMPSNTYTDLTLGASGATYTAPADGWFYLSKQSTTAGQYAIFTEGTDGISGSFGDGTWTTGYGVHILRPVAKGVTVKLNYSLAGATDYFRFIYAVGSESEVS